MHEHQAKPSNSFNPPHPQQSKDSLPRQAWQPSSVKPARPETLLTQADVDRNPALQFRYSYQQALHGELPSQSQVTYLTPEAQAKAEQEMARALQFRQAYRQALQGEGLPGTQTQPEATLTSEETALPAPTVESQIAEPETHKEEVSSFPIALEQQTHFEQASLLSTPLMATSAFGNAVASVEPILQDPVKEKQRQKDPRAKQPEIRATEAATGEHIKNAMDTANDPPGGRSATQGIHYASRYEYNKLIYERFSHDFRTAEFRPYYKNWKDEYRGGYADPKYWERIDRLDWRLLPGVSAAAGIKAWLRGLTIADCNTTIQAIYLDTMRAVVGDTKFDQKFGSTESAQPLPESQRLRISPSVAPGSQQGSVVDFLEPTDAAMQREFGRQGRRPNLKVGEWYSFINHPKYLLKHPGGDWQAENALYIGEEKGEQRWSGFGASNLSEEAMLETLAQAYNEPRSILDNREIRRLKQLAEKEGKSPELIDIIFHPERQAVVDGIPLGDVFPARITIADILAAPPYAHPLDGSIRRGGLQVDRGIKLSLNKLKNL
jgi:hypothetical protein